jgi:hypothetical protein
MSKSKEDRQDHNFFHGDPDKKIVGRPVRMG